MKLGQAVLLLSPLFERIQGREKACMQKEFFITVDKCSYENLVASIQQELSNPDPQTHSIIPCPHDAATELEFHIPDVGENAIPTEELISGFCKEAGDLYFNTHHVPWSEITRKGDRFDKEYYDGNSDWNEEHQSNYPHPPIVRGQPSNVLNRDAGRVDDLYETHLQKYPLQWPGDDPTNLSNFQNCQLQSAMCCWVSDRQANDNNGNCATPYDERCVDADPGDNTDLCAVDMSRSTPDSTHVDGGFAVFHEDEAGPVHCHGLAWGSDENEADFRYKANNLFYVSMSDHMHDRGYVRNVQGAPMCGCVEHMPIVKRSDCTEITASEFYEFSFPPVDSAQLMNVTISYVDIDYNACNGKQNNDLQSFVERLVDEGRMSDMTYYKFRQTVVGNAATKCVERIRDLYFDKGYKYIPKTSADFEPWEQGWCLNTNGAATNDKIKLDDQDYGQDQESLDQCLALCASYTGEFRATGCQAVWDDANRGCYLHIRETYRGSGSSNRKCAIMKQFAPVTTELLLPTMRGYCLDSSGNDQNTGVVQIYGGDFGPDESLQMDCLDRCNKASAVRRITGCEAIWWQNNRGCYIHTKEIAFSRNNDRHSCWIATPVSSSATYQEQAGYCLDPDNQNTGWRYRTYLGILSKTDCFAKCKEHDEINASACQLDKHSGACFIYDYAQQWIAGAGSGDSGNTCWLKLDYEISTVSTDSFLKYMGYCKQQDGHGSSHYRTHLGTVANEEECLARCEARDQYQVSGCQIDINNSGGNCYIYNYSHQWKAVMASSDTGHRCWIKEVDPIPSGTLFVKHLGYCRSITGQYGWNRSHLGKVGDEEECLALCQASSPTNEFWCQLDVNQGDCWAYDKEGPSAPGTGDSNSNGRCWTKV